MRTGIFFTVSDEDRCRLEAVISQPSPPQKHVCCCRIVVLSGDGVGTSAIMAATGKSKTRVWRRQEQFMTEGVDGPLLEKTRRRRSVQLEYVLCQINADDRERLKNLPLSA